MQTSSGTSSFKGIFTAIVTPFLPDGAIDWKGFERLLDEQLEAGVHGIVPCGTTGETPTLSEDEKAGLIERTVRRCKGRALVIAGTGSNDTRSTIEASKRAGDAGVDALLVVTPYYNKPSQAGLEAHFSAVADESRVPVILYNVPGRTGVSLTAATVGKLSRHPRIAGIKEATGNLGLLTEMRVAAGGAKNFVFLSGDDPTFWPFLACGGDGVISVASNVLPRCMRAIYERKDALALHESLYAFFNALFLEPNPVPVKAVLAWSRRTYPKVRLPLAQLTAETEQKLRKAWEDLPARLREDRPI